MPAVARAGDGVGVSADVERVGIVWVDPEAGCVGSLERPGDLPVPLSVVDAADAIAGREEETFTIGS